jgi:hypothetical protein
MTVLNLKIWLMKYVLSCPEGIRNKNVNAIPSSCIYKLFLQSSNYEIRDCSYDEGIAQKHAFRL